MIETIDSADRWPDPLADVDVDQLRRRRTARWCGVADDVVPAFVADGDGAVCPPVRSAIDALLDRGDLTYPTDESRLEVGAAFATRMDDRYGWAPDTARVALYSDVVQAASLAIDRLTSPGDGVMMHTPGFPPFLGEIVGLDRVVVPLPFERRGHSWRAPIDEVRAAVDDGARLLLLVNPHNPLGVVWTEGDLVALAELVVERDLMVVADEIYAEVTLGDATHVPFGSLGTEVEARTVTVTSAAKSHNLAGVRCAVAHVGERLDGLWHVPSAQLGQVSNIGCAATVAAWQEGDDWLEGYRRALTDRRDRFAAGLAAYLPAVDHVPAQGTFVAWLDTRPLGLPDPPAEFFLERGRVALDAGEPYGPGGEGRVRVSLATSAGLVDEILERMVTAIDIWAASR